MEKEPTVGTPLVLLTGAAGYVGISLLPTLLKAGYRVRCFVRSSDNFHSADAGTEVIQGDALNPDSLTRAMDGVDIAYYLIHSMGEGPNFADLDRAAAGNFAAAAQAAGVGRIVFLGALGDSGQPLSTHLRSRQEVGDLLRASGLPVIEFRASVIIGAGSVSFEMIRALTERLPIMLAPRWLRVQTQPISIGDTVEYLLAAAQLDVSQSEIFEIGGADKVAYGEILREYARQRRLRRLIISVPILTPRAFTVWLALITPVHASIGRWLLDGLRSPTVVRDDNALQRFSIRPIGLVRAIANARAAEDREWEARLKVDAFTSSRRSTYWGAGHTGTRYVYTHTMHVRAAAETVFACITRIGGPNGYYFADWLWRLRGWMDTIVGGVGFSRGRKNPGALARGDVVDFWRVSACEPSRRLLLKADMKVPGRAWLQFTLTTDALGCLVRQTAIFDARGVLGILYWAATYPIHRWLFDGTLRNMAKRCCPGVAMPEGAACALGGTATCPRGPQPSSTCPWGKAYEDSEREAES